MNNQQMESPKQKLIQISRDEVDIINDIRELNYGRINIIIHDGVVIGKEITRIVKRSKNRNNGGQSNDNHGNEHNNISKY